LILAHDASPSGTMCLFYHAAEINSNSCLNLASMKRSDSLTAQQSSAFIRLSPEYLLMKRNHSSRI